MEVTTKQKKKPKKQKEIEPAFNAELPPDDLTMVDRIGKLMVEHRLDEVQLGHLKITKKVHLMPVAPAQALTKEQKVKSEEADLFYSGQ